MADSFLRIVDTFLGSDVARDCPFTTAVFRHINAAGRESLDRGTLDSNLFTEVPHTDVLDVTLGTSILELLFWAWSHEEEHLVVTLPSGVDFHLGRAPKFESKRSFMDYKTACPQEVGSSVYLFGLALSEAGLAALSGGVSQGSVKVNELLTPEFHPNPGNDPRELVVGGLVVMTSILTGGLQPTIDGQHPFDPVCGWIREHALAHA